MKVEMKTPQEHLTSLRDQKIRLLKLNSEDSGVRLSAEELVREMTNFRIEHPEFASAIMHWEVELLNGFPGINPDGREKEAEASDAA